MIKSIKSDGYVLELHKANDGYFVSLIISGTEDDLYLNRYQLDDMIEDLKNMYNALLNNVLKDDRQKNQSITGDVILNNGASRDEGAG